MQKEKKNGPQVINLYHPMHSLVNINYLLIRQNDAFNVSTMRFLATL